jgi:Ohr subfamily peroxiredoxin
MEKIDKELYTAKVHTTGGRDGAARSSDGNLEVKLATPGTNRPGTNPEQLFAAGWSACFMSAIAQRNGRSRSRPTATSTPKWI